MANADFFASVFAANFWETLDRSALVEDDQSHFADADVVRWILEQVRPADVLEIGSWKGHSANFMADICRELDLAPRILCLDTFLGSAEHWAYPEHLATLHRRNGRATLLERFLANTIARGNTALLHPFPIDSANGASVLSHYGYRADLIYVDGGHGYANVRADLEAFWPLIGESGLMFGDDYGWRGVRRAVHDSADAFGVEVVQAGRKWLLPRTPLRDPPAAFERRTTAEG